jgi:hypothetical protein
MDEAQRRLRVEQVDSRQRRGRRGQHSPLDSGERGDGRPSRVVAEHRHRAGDGDGLRRQP